MKQTDEILLPCPVGLMAVIGELNLKVPLPAVRSKISAGARKTKIEEGVIYEQYPKTYLVKGLYENLKFAMRYEPVDLSVWQAACSKIDSKTIETWIRTEKTGIFYSILKQASLSTMNWWQKQKH